MYPGNRLIGGRRGEGTLLIGLGLALGLGLGLGPRSSRPGDLSAAELAPDEFQAIPLSVTAEIKRSGAPGFRLLGSGATGVAFTNRIDLGRSTTNQVFLNGSGVAAGDYDRDGRCDIYFSALDGDNALYRNLGHWRFLDQTGFAGVSCRGLDSTAAAFVDLDGDGWLDLVVNTVRQGTRLFVNQRDGRFAPHPTQPVINGARAGMSMAFADADQDGDLDFYITNYRSRMLMDEPNTFFEFKTEDGRTVIDRVNGRSALGPDLKNRFRINDLGGIDELGEEDSFYLNQSGSFVLVDPTGGRFLNPDGSPLIEPRFGWGLSVMFRDVNRDSLPDFYVCNDFETPDELWINRGRGVFQAADSAALRKMSFFSMGIDFADLDRNGRDDFVVLDMLSRFHRQRMNTQPTRMLGNQNPLDPRSQPAYSMNTVFSQIDDLRFAEVGFYSGLAATEWSWAAAFLDVDLDGWEDLLVTNGTLRDGRNLDVSKKLDYLRNVRKLGNREMFRARNEFPARQTPNLIFRNGGDFRFEDVTDAWGFDAPAVSHGIALADLDDDGDQDVIINNLNQGAFVYENLAVQPRVAIELSSESMNTRCIGARVRVSSVGFPVQSQEIIAGGRYLSSDQPRRVFAVHPEPGNTSIEITWPDGRVSVISDVLPDHLYRVREPESARNLSGSAAPESSPAPSPSSTTTTTTTALFVDVSDLLGHRHFEDEYDDFEMMPGLPWRLSRSGPGAVWLDFDRDGWEDLLIGGSRNGSIAIHRNTNGTGFVRQDFGANWTPLPNDQTALLVLRPGPDQVLCLAGLSHSRVDAPSNASFAIYNLQSKNRSLLNLGPPRAIGSMAAADIDGDGDLDLFTGGSYSHDGFPDADPTRLFRLETGRYQPDDANESVFAGRHAVSSSVFSDVDRDGDPDLVVVGHFGSIGLFINDRGIFRDGSADWGLNAFPGLWNGIATADFNEDQLPDLMVSNWGLNSRRQLYAGDRIRLFHGDFNQDGRADTIEALWEPDQQKWMASSTLSELARVLPWLPSQMDSYDRFATRSIEALLGDQADSAMQLFATELRPLLFLNRGNRFESVPLPPEVHWTPTFGVATGDFNGDGHQDAFFAQNFFGVRPAEPRMDAGHGCMLLGDGEGHFTWLRPGESGVWVTGEQRSATVGDYDHDGRLDLLVTQNNDETKLFRNQSAPPAVRLVLEGPATNPAGIGTSLWVEYERGSGALFEIQSGTGYLGDGSKTVLLPRSHIGKGTARNVSIRFPTGETRTLDVPHDPSMTIQVTYN